MALSCSSAALGVVPSALASLCLTSATAQWKPACANFSDIRVNEALQNRIMTAARSGFAAGHSVALNSGNSSFVMNIAPASVVSVALRTVVTKATADALEAATSAAEEAAAPAITTILSEADLIKKKAKRDELRRKRLVRKRKLRKKGRWPPSKMAKLKNV